MSAPKIKKEVEFECPYTMNQFDSFMRTYFAETPKEVVETKLVYELRDNAHLVSLKRKLQAACNHYGLTFKE